MSISLSPDRVAGYRDVLSLLWKYASWSDIRSALADPDLQIADLNLEDEEASEDAEEFTRELEKRGPAFIKIGQLLSTRSDLMPPTWMKALRRLQDQVEPFAFTEVREIVEKEIGTSIANAFDQFDEKPLASASLGQVHRAILRDSKMEVAVKVQRPGIRTQVAEDFAAMADIAELLEKHSEHAQGIRIHAIVTEARQHVLAELDYKKEARNLIRLSRNLKDFPNLVVPSPVPDYSSSKVLTMQYIHGTRITDLSKVVLTELDGHSLAEELFQAYLRQVLVDGFFHADPHPGNVLLTQDRRIALIDLGMVGQIPEGMRDDLLALMAALSEGRSDAVLESALRIGRPGPNFNEQEFSEGLTRIVQDRSSCTVEDLEIGTVVMQVTQLSGKHGLILPNELFILGKMLLNLDMVGKHLDPTFNPDAAIRKYSSELAHQRMKDTFTQGNLLTTASDLKNLLDHGPQRLNKALEIAAENKLKIHVEGLPEQAFLNGIEKIANRITVGIILAALIVGAALMMRVNTGFTIGGYPGIAMLFFLLASAGAFLLAWRILFHRTKADKK